MRKLYPLILFAFFFSFTAFSQMNILLVNDNGYAPERMEPLKIALTNGSYTYDTINTTMNGGSPTFAELGGYDVVIWYTGNDGAGLSLWNGTDTDNQHIIDYIDNGGMFWLQGLDWLHDRYSGAPDSFVAGDFVYDYLGIAEYAGQAHLDDGVVSDGVPQFDLVNGNGIFTLDPMLWTYATMWYADALEKTPAAANLYMMGPAGYDLDAYAGSIYNEKVNGGFTGRVISIATETARFDTQGHLDQYIDEGLTYFDQFVISVIEVTDINVSAAGGSTSISTDGGTLQMNAEILPANATNQTIAWSVIDGTGTATINNSGLLQGTGTPAGNGTITVQASAVDGSGIVGTLEITISNQGANSDFHVLLVNDNNNDASRYLLIETALENNSYNYDIYNTITSGNFPDPTYLSNYDAVIWYTGNDGVDLYLWDLTDTEDYKFNAPLIDYIDNGGLLWVQGLDFLYDVYGNAPDVFTEGKFTYDYMGLEEYHAQSWGDDGNTGVEQIEVVADNGIFSLSPVMWAYTELHYVDALVETADAYPLYMMGPAGYMFEDYACSIYKMNNTGMVMLSAIETARIDTQENTDTFIDEGLIMMENYTAGSILITDIEVTGEGNETTIDIDGGELQMLAEVFPHFANNQNVSWSVVDATATAFIDNNGILQSTGTPAGNGNVYAKATANDGSGIMDSIMITISNQGSGNNFNVLLVNDNANGTDRYLEIDTTLNNLGYNYDIYNTTVTGEYPEYTLLNNYQAVIWYTGNDGVDLFLWDLSDPDDYKFNEELINYVDNGGFVWVQGLDFLYDVFGNAPDTFEEGSFVYDYMGIQEYHAQSYSDDGDLGLPQMDTVADNGIFRISPVEWTFSTMWYADALQKTAEAQNVYMMGADDYAFSDYSCGLYKYNSSGGMIMSFAIETARINTEAHTDSLIDQGLSFFEFALENDIFVSDINVSSFGGATTIDVDGGTLQCFADVFPVFAPNRVVDWSIVDGTATAFISENGMIAATGNPANGNGTIWAKAAATDGSGVADSIMITISNQTLPDIPVTEINVSGEAGITSIDTDGGSLQMLAEVLPEDASDDSVLWSVVPGTTNASIDELGVLTANGEDNGNGTVYAKAIAIDGSGIMDSLLITITNQTSDVVMVNEINISGEGGATTISQDGGSLQMLADVFPTNATIDSVLWSVINGSTSANINSFGLLSATGEDDGNGTVWAKATAYDGSGIVDSLEITITNQESAGTGQILLVNDNANGTDRYLVIDTTLNNLGYDYEIYNAVDQGSFPDLNYLENFELVIWYTGNDGLDLYLWDLSNPDDYQFNAPLKNYIDNGGTVWIQGLDFLYDAYGAAPVSFTQGQFTYDYMGIEEYHAQSHVDDGIFSDGVPQLDLVPNNGICNITPIEWAYETMWYVDAIALSPGTKGLYTMGPAEYDFSDYYSAFYRVLFPGTVITCTFETARIDSRANTETFFYEVIENIDQMVGIESITTSEIKVYPNPATNIVHIQIKEEMDKNTLFELYNINGQLLMQSPLSLDQNGETIIDINLFGSGIYFYKIISNEKSTSGKLIIQKN